MNWLKNWIKNFKLKWNCKCERVDWINLAQQRLPDGELISDKKELICLDCKRGIKTITTTWSKS